jgi:ribose transport system substrate-binding protein
MLAGTMFMAGAWSASAAGGLSVAYVDGSCGNSWRTIVQAEAAAEVKLHPEIGRYTYQCAQGNLSQYISAFQALTAQKYDIIVTLDDFGKSGLPALRAAYKAGVVVVPWQDATGGAPGTDYSAEVDDDTPAMMKLAAIYFAQKIPGKGVIVGIGGKAGNQQDAEFEKYLVPDLKDAAGDRLTFIPPRESGAWGDWNPAKSAQAMATALQKYPQIDGVISIEATTIPPELQQFIQAGRKPPVFVSLDVNGMMGAFLKNKPQYPSLEYGFMSARTWGVRNAIKVGLAIKAKQPESSYKDLEIISQKISDCTDVCQQLYRSDLPDSYVPTSQVPPDELKKVLK